MADASWSSACAARRPTPISRSRTSRQEWTLPVFGMSRPAMGEAVSGASRPPTRHGVFAALRRAVPVFFSAHVVGVIFLPIALAALAFIIVGGFGWTPLTHWLEAAVFGSDASGGWRAFAAGAVAFLIFMLVAVLAALLAIAIFAMPVIVRA